MDHSIGTDQIQRMGILSSTEIATGTDTGRVRPKNEDSLGVDREEGLLVLADGMGGHRGGEVASAMAVECLLQALGEIREEVRGQRRNQLALAETRLRDAIDRCNRKIYRTGLEQPQYQGMGATVVAALLADGRLYYVYAGDSRLYLLREGRLQQLTRDHTLLQEMKDTSMTDIQTLEATIPGNIVTQALGAQERIEPDMGFVDLQAGDLFLVCSDGLHDRVSKDVLLDALSNDDDLHERVHNLIALANAAGGEDNISVILMQIKDTGHSGGSILQRLFGR